MTLLIVLLCLAALILMVRSPAPAITAPSISLEQRLRSHQVVSRLLRNANWAPAAEAAIESLVRGKDCPIQGWRKSKTWAQVEMVYHDLAGRQVR
jgi:hypothetical protein